MPRMFTEKLLRKAKVVLEKKSGRRLSDDEVEIMLDRLSQLGMLFAKNVMEGRTKIKKQWDQFKEDLKLNQ